MCLVATVGYIVGLGDRHIQNILIDEQSAELVHIDLGTALRGVASLCLSRAPQSQNPPLCSPLCE